MKALWMMALGMIVGYGLWCLANQEGFIGIDDARPKNNWRSKLKYPVILTMGGTMAGLYLTYGWSTGLVMNTFLICFLALISLIDISYHIIPNRVLIIGLLVGLLFIIIFSHQRLPEALLACGAVGGLTALISYGTKGALGMGDVKLLACLGILLGLWGLLKVLLWAAILSGLTGLILLMTKRVTKKTSMPFAPFILIGSLLILFIR